jgi:hypothetical protein
MHDSITEISEWSVGRPDEPVGASTPGAAEGEWLLDSVGSPDERALPAPGEFVPEGPLHAPAAGNADSDWTCVELRAARRRAALKAATWREDLDSRARELDRRLRKTSTV